MNNIKSNLTPHHFAGGYQGEYVLPDILPDAIPSYCYKYGKYVSEEQLREITMIKSPTQLTTQWEH